MKTRISGASGGLWAVTAGIGTMLAVSLGLAAILAAVIGGGALPPGSISPAAGIITVAAAMIGALLCGKKAGKARLPLCIAACVGYLLLVFILRGLIFHSVGEKPWMIPIFALAGCILGALLSSRKKRRRY